jgi:hypothetical protein
VQSALRKHLQKLVLQSQNVADLVLLVHHVVK